MISVVVVPSVTLAWGHTEGSTTPPVPHWPSHRPSSRYDGWPVEPSDIVHICKPIQLALFLYEPTHRLIAGHFNLAQFIRLSNDVLADILHYSNNAWLIVIGDK